MGAACCVATRDRTIQHGSSGEIMHRNFRHSPSWSFRWDNRVGVAGEESSIGGGSVVATRSDLLDLKSTTDVPAHVSDGGSSLENYRLGALRKSPLNEERNKNLRTSASAHSIARNTSTKVKQSTESPQVSDPTSLKLSPSMHSSPSLSMSPRSAQSHQLSGGSPGHQLVELASDTHSSFRNSPSMSSIVEGGQIPYGIPTASNDSTRVSYGRSSNGWSTNSFSHLMMSSSQREHPSFDSDSCTFSCGRKSGSTSMDFQTCGLCSKLLTEKKSGWSTQSIIADNELSVIAVLVCGHVYHAECLEGVTPEFNKYDPACPICTLGEKQTLKMSGKSRNQLVVGPHESFGSDNYWKSSSSREGRSPKLSASSSLRISGAKPFLRRHFSFGSRGNKFASDSQSVRKKGLF